MAIKTKADVVSGNMVVFSAAQGSETAYPYQQKQHGLFTYYLLEQLQQSGGAMSLGELSDQVTKFVGRASIVENDKSQTPMLIASTTAQDWRKWVLTHKRASRYETIKRNAQTATSTPTPTPQPVVQQTATHPQTPEKPEFEVGNVQFTMIRVDGGTFQMGATSEQGFDAYDSEKPVHQVTLSTYYIGETEVTQELWQAVMGENPSRFKGNRRPVESVSWKDCQSFIEKLNKKTGLQFRLPTEAEWEYAARGGNKSQGYKYSGSNNLGDVAWYTDNSGLSTQDVKTKQANELGIYDMSGNVWEWCQDWYGSYSAGSQTNPTGASSGSLRVFRGGGWSIDARDCRVSFRSFWYADLRNCLLGLRLALQ